MDAGFGVFEGLHIGRSSVFSELNAVHVDERPKRIERAIYLFIYLKKEGKKACVRVDKASMDSPSAHVLCFH